MAVTVGVSVCEDRIVGVGDGVAVAVPDCVHVGVGVLLGDAVGVYVQVWIGVGECVRVGEEVKEGAAVPMWVELGEGRMVFAMVAVVDGAMVADGLGVGSCAPLAADATLIGDSPRQK